jgi:hypothetical protein
MLEFWFPYFWTTRISHRKWSRAIGPSPAKKRTQKAEVATVARGAVLAGKDLRFQGLSRGEHGNQGGGVTVNIGGCSMFFNHTWHDWLRWQACKRGIAQSIWNHQQWEIHGNPYGNPQSSLGETYGPLKEHKRAPLFPEMSKRYDADPLRLTGCCRHSLTRPGWEAVVKTHPQWLLVFC